MPLRVKSSDVLDTTHAIAHPFEGRIMGYFRREGPNSWDDYVYVEDPSDQFEALPGVEVQLEPRGPEIRVRYRGKVVRVRWEPDASEREKLGEEASPRDIRHRFVEHFLRPFARGSVLGVTGVAVKKLTSD